MASGTIKNTGFKAVKTDTVSGTTGAAGGLVTTLSDSNIRIIEATAPRSANIVLITNSTTGNYIFKIVTSANLSPVGNTNVTVEYSYIEVN